MANDGTVKIGVELDEKELEKSFKKLDEQAQKTSKELGKIDDALKLDPGNVELLTEKQKLLTSAVSDSKEKVALLTKELQKAKESGLEDSDAGAYRNLVVSLSNATSEAKQFEDQLDDVNQKIKNGGKEAKDFSSALSKLGSVASTALKGGIAVIGGVATAATGAVTGLLALESATEEYRIAQGKLNTAFEAAGYGPETASEAYTRFFEILGDTDTATEASQLLAKLAQSEEDVSTWADIAAGVSGTFGDSLPIEGLIEASNETAKVGQVTGVLADALNWAGISEDEFNEKLASCSDESERNQLIMDTLSGTYDEASDAFYRNNEALVAARDAQVQMDDALADLGGAVSDVKTQMMSEFLPAMSEVTSGLAGMLTGTEGAEQQFSDGIGALIDAGVERLPEFLDFGVQILTAILEGLISNIPALIEAVPQVVEAIATALVELWPSLVESGSQILEQVGNGILQYVPELIARLPDVIVAILNFLTENFPLIIEKGAEFIVNLALGIIGAIPDLVAKLPEVINAFVDFVVKNLPVIVSSGSYILASLAKGIIGAIPELVAALPEVMNAIINVLGALMDGVVEIGADIVRGIWEGISSMVGWIGEKVSGFVGGIVDNVKGALGIHSPSTVFRDQIGKNIGLGTAEGITRSLPDVKASMNKMSKELVASIPAAQIGVYAANQSMAPMQSRYYPETSGGTAGTGNGPNSGTQNVSVVIRAEPREMAHALVPYIESESDRRDVRR